MDLHRWRTEAGGGHVTSGEILIGGNGIRRRARAAGMAQKPDCGAIADGKQMQCKGCVVEFPS